MDEKSILLRRHGGFRGLTDEQIQQIAADCELLELETGDVLHRAGEHLKFLYLIVQGRFEQTIQDPHGNVVQRKYLGRGSQFGAVAAAQVDPVPVTVVAVEPSSVLRLEYDTFLEHVTGIPKLLRNLLRDIGSAFKQTFSLDRIHAQSKIVMVVHASPASRPLAVRLIDRLQELGEHPCLLTDDPSWESRSDVPQLLLVRDGHWLSDEAVRSKIAQWSAHERVFIDVAGDVERDRLIRGIKLADRVLACIGPDDWQRLAQDLRELEAHEPEWRQKINAVWVMDGGQMHVPRADQLHEVVSHDFKVSFADPPANCGAILNHGVERIVHALRGVRLGIALGGGAARGMAHLGVLKALEQHGIIVDMIAGTSAGAMTGTFYTSGMDVDYAVDRFVNDLTPPWLFRRMRSGGYWYLLYKYRRGQFDPMLRRYLSDLRFEQLPIPMNTITVDLVSGEPKVRDRGDAVDGIIESINLPGLSAPICRNGQALVDGGLVNNVPANVLVSKGCNFVIAVSVTAKLEQEFAKIRPDSPGPKYRTPSVLQTIMRGYLVQSVNMNSVGVQPADLVIDVDVTRFDMAEFTRTDELAAIGLQTTEASIESIRTALADLDKELFSGTSPQRRV
jgi:predicted acylesterase/phospholipase RssA/CRP-like cAMP-binding protein